MMPSSEFFRINLSDAALRQIKLIEENDYTLQGKSFRLKIGGKGCDGFTYEMGFDDSKEDDLCLIYPSQYGEIKLILDPFTSHYCKEGHLDFLFNAKTNEDGFIFINDNEANYVGKFFKDESMLPGENR